MSKRQLLILIGFFMIVLQTGFPPEWNKILIIVSGVLIIVIAFMLKPEVKVWKKSDSESSYVDNRPTPGKI